MQSSQCLKISAVLILFLLAEPSSRPASDQAPVWTSIGPSPLANCPQPQCFFSGRAAALAVDPRDQNHWLAGPGNSGLWETRDAGENWVPLSDAWPTLSIGAVAFAPSNASIIYVGTGEADAGN